MTMYPHSGVLPPQHANTPGLRSASHGVCRALPTLLATALLAACSTTPLPPWPSVRKVPPPKPPQAVVVPAPLGQPLAVPPATAPSPALPAGQPAALGNVLDNAAVAARFPDPAVRYHTPGLAAQRSAFTTNAELAQWLRDLAAGPLPAGTQAALLALGPSQGAEPIHALVLTRAPGTDPNSLAESQRPTVLLIGQQHGDEPAGSEALLVMAQELLRGPLAPLLERINVILVPRANPDGAQAGTRNTANGIDLNRDHLLLRTPEARALAALVRDYRPLLVLDAHEYPAAGDYLEKLNALPRYDALLQYATTANMPEFVTKAAQEWYHEPMVKALQAQGLSSDWYHTPATSPAGALRMAMGRALPDNARNANGLKNAVSLVVATRGIGLGHRHIQRRVHTHVTALTNALRSTAERADKLEQVREFVDRDTTALACHGQVVLEAGPTPLDRNTTALDPNTGADRTLAVPWDSALQLRTLQSRPRPCGYWLAPGATTAVERLTLLGLQVLRVAEPGGVLVDSFRAADAAASTQPDARAAITLVRSAIDVPAGSFYVPLNQPLAHLAVAALEPGTPVSYTSHGLIESLSDTARVMSTPSLIFEEME